MEMKLSFSLSSKPSSSSSRPNPPKPPKEIRNGGGKAEDGEPKPQFVTVFDPAQTLDAQARLVIPPIPNADLRPTKKMKNLPLPTAADDPSAAAASETRFVLDTSTGDAPASNIPYGLTLRSNGAAASADSRFQEEDGDRRRAASVEDSMLKRFKEDMKNLPEDRGFDEFNDIPVEDIGAGGGRLEPRGWGGRAEVKTRGRGASGAGDGGRWVRVPRPWEGDQSRGGQGVVWRRSHGDGGCRVQALRPWEGDQSRGAARSRRAGGIGCGCRRGLVAPSGRGSGLTMM